VINHSHNFKQKGGNKMEQTNQPFEEPFPLEDRARDAKLIMHPVIKEVTDGYERALKLAGDYGHALKYATAQYLETIRSEFEQSVIELSKVYQRVLPTLPNMDIPNKHNNICNIVENNNLFVAGSWANALGLDLPKLKYPRKTE